MAAAHNITTVEQFISSNNLTVQGFALFAAANALNKKQLADFNYLQVLLNDCLTDIEDFELFCTKAHTSNVNAIFSNFIEIQNGYGWVTVQYLLNQVACACTFIQFKTLLQLLINNSMLVNEAELNGTEEDASEVLHALINDYNEVRKFL